MIKIESIIDESKIQIGDVIRKNTFIAKVMNIDNKHIRTVFKLEGIGNNNIYECSIQELICGTIENR